MKEEKKVTKKDTAMMAAFAKAGLPRHVLQMYGPLSAFIEAGGTKGELLSAYDEVYFKLTGKHAQQHKPEIVHGQGHGSRAVEGQSETAESVHEPTHEIARGQGHMTFASGQSAAAKPPRDPSQSDVKAAKLAMRLMSRSIHDTFEIRGRAIGDVKRGELRTIGNDCRRDAYVAYHVREYIDIFAHNADMLAPIREIVPVEELERIIKRAEDMAEDGLPLGVQEGERVPAAH